MPAETTTGDDPGPIQTGLVDNLAAADPGPIEIDSIMKNAAPETAAPGLPPGDAGGHAATGGE